MSQSPFPYQSLLHSAPVDRKALLRHLLLDLPTRLTKKQVTISSLARSLDISRITASAFFNMTQTQFPLSLKMAVKLHLATQGYLPAIQRMLRDDPGNQIPLWIYPATPEDWLKLDDNYRDPSTADQIEELMYNFNHKIKRLAAYSEGKFVLK